MLRRYSWCSVLRRGENKVRPVAPTDSRGATGGRQGSTWYTVPYATVSILPPYSTTYLSSPSLQSYQRQQRCPGKCETAVSARFWDQPCLVGLGFSAKQALLPVSIGRRHDRAKTMMGSRLPPLLPQRSMRQCLALVRQRQPPPHLSASFLSLWLPAPQRPYSPVWCGEGTRRWKVSPPPPCYALQFSCARPRQPLSLLPGQTLAPPLLLPPHSLLWRLCCRRGSYHRRREQFPRYRCLLPSDVRLKGEPRQPVGPACDAPLQPPRRQLRQTFFAVACSLWSRRHTSPRLRQAVGEPPPSDLP